MDFKTTKKQFDLVIIGSGGAGLMSAISAYDAGLKNIAVISKVIPTNSHTVAAKGGINAALGNVIKDDWKWHAYDTLKGSDYLADADAVEILCKNAQAAVLELEKMGVVFSRDEKGNIAQRAYGAQTTNFGKGEIAYRACYAKDKTGHTMLHTLYQQALNRDIKFFSEFFVIDLLIENNNCYGCVTIDLNLGEIVIFESKNLILATGGYSQIFENTTSSLICSGDGSALILKAGLELQDMEFIQFHPTGIAGLGFLVTEAARGEGGYLLNASGDRFMKNYAPDMMELSSRDLISQAMAVEIFEGRGCGKNKDFLHLDLRHLSLETLTKKLPGVVELVKNFAKLDVKKDLIPVAPSAHYTMGGIPTNLDCVVMNKGVEVQGLMAVGEAACVSVHGANRLGCNSLLDLIVFGKIAGKKAALDSGRHAMDPRMRGDDREERSLLLSSPRMHSRMRESIADSKIQEFKNLFSQGNKINYSHLKKTLQKNNEKNLGVFRNEELLQEGLEKTLELLQTLRYAKISDNNLILNENLIAHLELENLILNSLAANFSALNRKESRGAHYRSDFKDEDCSFLKHSVVSFDHEQKNKLSFRLKELRNCAVSYETINNKKV